MFRIFMLSVWAGGAYFLAKSYFSGIAQFSQYQHAAQQSVKDLAMAGPWAGFKDMSDMGMWFHIAALITLILYAMFTKQVWKEFGPSAK
jgi:hypothetical protein